MPHLNELRFELDTQQLHNWCWAAVAAGIHNYLANQSPQLEQCKAAATLLPHANPCSPTPDLTKVDVPQRLDLALGAAIHPLGWSVKPVVHGPLTFEQVKEEIDNGRPIGACIVWEFGQGAHFNVICGYRESSTGNQLFVSDPFFVDSQVDYEEFVTNYQGEGTWHQTILISK